jgi:hypothetical protein
MVTIVRVPALLSAVVTIDPNAPLNVPTPPVTIPLRVLRF